MGTNELHPHFVVVRTQIFLRQPLLELLSMELKSFKRGRSKFSCLGWTLKKPKKLQERKYKPKKKPQINIKQTTWKRKNSKTWNWKSLEAYLKLLCCLCVPHFLQEQEHNECICENLKQEIRVFQHTFLKKPSLEAWFQA